MRVWNAQKGGRRWITFILTISDFCLQHYQLPLQVFCFNNDRYTSRASRDNLKIAAPNSNVLQKNYGVKCSAVNIYCLTSRRQALLGRKFQLHALLAACAWVGRLRGDRDHIRIKTFTRPDECILNAKMNWIEMWRARACGREVAAFAGISFLEVPDVVTSGNEWNNFREANLSRHK